MESKCIHSLFSPIAPSPHPLLQPAQSLCPLPSPHPQDTHTCLHKVPALELPHPPHLPHPTPTPAWEGPTSPAASSMGQSQVPHPRVYRPKFCLESAPVTFGSDGVICVSFSLFPGGSDGKESACNVRDVQSLGQEDPLEEGMETHSSIFAQRIPWTEEPSGLQSMRSQRIAHDWAANTFLSHTV